MSARILAVLVAAACLVALAIETRAQPRSRHPSVVEKTCRLPGNLISVPCRFLDEYLETSWEI